VVSNAKVDQYGDERQRGITQTVVDKTRDVFAKFFACRKDNLKDKAKDIRAIHVGFL
jgi:hypothetical protein